MTSEEANMILDQLKNGDITEYRVPRDEFMTFRAEMIKRDDKKAYRGTAKVGGDVSFVYEPGWTA